MYPGAEGGRRLEPLAGLPRLPARGAAHPAGHVHGAGPVMIIIVVMVVIIIQIHVNITITIHITKLNYVH